MFFITKRISHELYFTVARYKYKEYDNPRLDHTMYTTFLIQQNNNNIKLKCIVNQSSSENLNVKIKYNIK